MNCRKTAGALFCGWLLLPFASPNIALAAPPARFFALRGAINQQPQPNGAEFRPVRSRRAPVQQLAPRTRLPRGRSYYQGRYFGNYNNRYYGPQYGYF